MRANHAAGAATSSKRYGTVQLLRPLRSARHVLGMRGSKRTMREAVMTVRALQLDGIIETPEPQTPAQRPVVAAVGDERAGKYYFESLVPGPAGPAQPPVEHCNTCGTLLTGSSAQHIAVPAARFCSPQCVDLDSDVMAWNARHHCWWCHKQIPDGTIPHRAQNTSSVFCSSSCLETAGYIPKAAPARKPCAHCEQLITLVQAYRHGSLPNKLFCSAQCADAHFFVHGHHTGNACAQCHQHIADNDRVWYMHGSTLNFCSLHCSRRAAGTKA